MIPDCNTYILFDITSENKRIFFVLILLYLLLSFSHPSAYGGETGFQIYRRTAEQEITRKKDIIEQDPIDFQSYFELGLAYLTLGKHKEEVYAYKEALSLNPKSALIHFNLSIAYNYLKEGKKAIYHMQIAQNLYTQKRNHRKIRSTQRQLKRYSLRYPELAGEK
tara:strand:+ start:54 stop:548 length:495 start_codon:yes stop_codon:yes gene_type:complete